MARFHRETKKRRSNLKFVTNRHQDRQTESIVDKNDSWLGVEINKRLLFVESLVADSPSDEPLHSSSQQLLQQAVYRCPLCAHLTASLKQLVNHLMRHPLQNDPQSQSGHYPCTVCGKEFSCTAVLASHIRVIHQGLLCFLALH